MPARTKLIAGLLVAALFLLTLEGLVRLTMGAPTPELAAVLPDGSGPLIKRTSAGIQPTYQIDRRQAVVGPKGADGLRVVWLGGSSVHGGTHGISPSQEAPGRAGELLGIESLNFGGIGMDTVSIGAIFDDVLSLNPDAVVLYTGHNELGNAVFTGRYGDAGTARIATLRAQLGSSRLFQALEMVVRGRETLTLPSEGSEGQFVVDARTRREILWRFEERIRHIVGRAEAQGVKVVLATLMSNAVAPSMEFECRDAMRRAGFRSVRAEALPVRELSEADIGAAEAMSPGCRDLRWLRARRAGDRAALDALRDDDPLPVRAGRALNQVIREVASDTGAMLVDVDQMARAAGGGLEPSAWFLDPMHFTVAGHDALARMVAQPLADLAGVAGPSLAPAPTIEADLAGCGGEACRERAGVRPEFDFNFGQGRP